MLDRTVKSPPYQPMTLAALALVMRLMQAFRPLWHQALLWKEYLEA